MVQFCINAYVPNPPTPSPPPPICDIYGTFPACMENSRAVKENLFAIKRRISKVSLAT